MPGMGDLGALDTLLSYTLLAVGTDLALFSVAKNMPLRNPENLLTGLLAGALGHKAKFLIERGLATLTSPPTRFVALDLLRSIAGHIVFAALGGMVGALVLRARPRAGFFVYLAKKR